MESNEDRKKRLAAKKGERDRSRAKERRDCRRTLKQSPTLDEFKVGSHTVYLRDGRPSRQYYAYWHICIDNNRVGRVWLSRDPEAEEEAGVYITVEINKVNQGKGIGRIVFRRAAELSNEDTIAGVSRKGNTPSIKAMESAGYTFAGTNKSGESRYVWHRMIISREVPVHPTYKSESVDTSDHNISKNQASEILTLRDDHGVGKDSRVASAFSKLFNAETALISQYRRCYHKNGRTVYFSMVHSWALVGASYHIWRTGRIPESILHVDDHTDLGPCLMDDNAHQPLGRGGVPYILNEPSTITENLVRGSFNKGSFLTAFLALAGVRHLHHMCWTRKPSNCCVSVVHETSHVRRAKIGDTGTTTFTSGVAIPQESFDDQCRVLWVDIDLDAFCNRYNGDSDRHSIQADLAERRRLDRRLRETIEQIRESTALRSAELVTVATSPGFCPSEYWEDVSRELLDALGISWSPF